jgi:hypothetical protein
VNAGTADVLIIGGGLHGCRAALHLACAGVRAIVVEKNYVGRHASGVNAGGVRTLSRHEAEIPPALAALELWHRIADLVGGDCGFESFGQIRVAENQTDPASLQQREQRLKSLDYSHEAHHRRSDHRGKTTLPIAPFSIRRFKDSALTGCMRCGTSLDNPRASKIAVALHRDVFHVDHSYRFPSASRLRLVMRQAARQAYCATAPQMNYRCVRGNVVILVHGALRSWRRLYIHQFHRPWRYSTSGLGCHDHELRMDRSDQTRKG